MTAFAVADPLDGALGRLPRALRAPAFALAVLTIDAVRDAGIAYVEDHVLERAYGTSDRPAGAWPGRSPQRDRGRRGDHRTAGRPRRRGRPRAPRRWPAIAIGATAPLLALATVVAPTLIMPLFNRYEPVTGTLEARIRALAARYGSGDAAILRFDMSRQTKKANAFVTGVFGQERIVLGDTLIANFDEDETLFVVAHELGHYLRRDPWLGIGLGTAALAVTVLSAGAMLRRSTGRGLDSPAQGARLAFYATLVQLVPGAVRQRGFARDGAARRPVRARRDRRPRCRYSRLHAARRPEPGRARSAALGAAAVRLTPVAGRPHPQNSKRSGSSPPNARPVMPAARPPAVCARPRSPRSLACVRPVSRAGHVASNYDE